ncbi:Ribonucleases P/MRP protein subunit pop1, variant 2 [Bonamia ostreae]
MARNPHILPKSLRGKALKDYSEKDMKKIKRRKKRKRVTSSALKIRRNLNKQNNAIWMETHLWHAKRMHMATLWGYKIPISPTAKSDKFLQKASCNDVAIYDFSYKICYQINLSENPQIFVFLKNLGFLNFSDINQNSFDKQYSTVIKTDEYEIYKIETDLFLWAHPSLKQSLECKMKSNNVKFCQRIFSRFKIIGAKSISLIKTTFSDISNNFAKSDFLQNFKNDNIYHEQIDINSAEKKFLVLMAINIWQQKPEIKNNKTQNCENINEVDIILPNKISYSIWLNFIKNGGKVFGLKNYLSFCINKGKLEFPFNQPFSEIIKNFTTFLTPKKSPVKFLTKIGNLAKIENAKINNIKSFKKSKMQQILVNLAEFYNEKIINDGKTKDYIIVRIKMLKGNPDPGSKIVLRCFGDNNVHHFGKKQFDKLEINGIVYQKTNSIKNGCVYLIGILLKENLENMRNGQLTVLNKMSRNGYKGIYKMIK